MFAQTKNFNIMGGGAEVARKAHNEKDFLS